MSDPERPPERAPETPARAPEAGSGVPAPRVWPPEEPPATEDEQLLESPPEAPAEDGAALVGREAWRVFRIMGEFVEGFERLAGIGPCVSFFGSARVTRDDPVYALCVETARQMGEAGFGIITGGGPGIMEAANRGAREAGVPSVGCNIELPFEQGTNPWVDLSITFRYFFVRKTMFVKYAEAFLIFPGGFGTMDELFEALTLVQTAKVRDFPVVLVGRDYWKGMLDWIEGTMATSGKISPEDQRLLLLADTPEEAVRHVVENYRRHQARLGRARAAVGRPRRPPPGRREPPPG